MHRSCLEAIDSLIEILDGKFRKKEANISGRRKYTTREEARAEGRDQTGAI
jgi:hypothetical protein